MVKQRCLRVRPAVVGAVALLAGLAVGVSAASTGVAGGAANGAAVDFNRDIRPILSQNCFKCHGPDAAQRKAGLRLDQGPEKAVGSSGRLVITPRDPKHSLLAQRVTAAPVHRMPPSSSGLFLKPAQIALLQRWIAQGAKSERHWSLVPPKAAPLPAVRDGRWVRNPIDAFVLSRLEKEGLKPSPEADRTTLLRRVSLDLTGLPPNLVDVDAFLSDGSPNAYEKVVDRLLASPAYGERMARPWLDAARYADTNGYQSDGDRIMWRWRDWVIDAYNADMPFDRFTIEQLAGDLLPKPTIEQRIATGFNRNHRGNGEGGIIPEEYQCEYVVDRVDTTATVWLGLTMGCARCHDHKYDPISQKDFYRVFALFNNLPERGRANKYGNSPPMITAPTKQQQEELLRIDDRIALIDADLKRLEPETAAAQSTWEEGLQSQPPAYWIPNEGTVATAPFKRQIEAPQYLGPAAQFGGSESLDAGDVAKFGFYDSFTLSAWLRSDGPRGGTIISRMTDVPRGDGYSLTFTGGKIQFNLVKRWLDDALRVETSESVPPGEWHHVTATYDGSRLASGVRIYIDGHAAKLNALIDELNQSFDTKEPLRIAGGHGPEGRFHGALASVRVYDRALRHEEAVWLAGRESLQEVIAMPAAQRGKSVDGKLRQAFLAMARPQAVVGSPGTELEFAL